jgi:hypothetical protein
MAGQTECDLKNNAAAPPIVAGLINREFGNQAVDLPDINPSLAADVVRTAKANKILKPALNQFTSLGLPIPEEVQSEVALYFRRAMKTNAAALATMCEVTRALAAAGIVHAAFKGPARQIALAQDVFERPVADLDILVKQSDFAAATELLKEMGYWIPLFCDSRWWRHYLGEHPLIPNEQNRIGVDLHHRTQHPSCPRPRDQGAMLDNLTWTDVGGQKIPIFGPISIFLNTVMSIVKGLANREPTGAHVLDLARQLHAADATRLTEFEHAAHDQRLDKSYAVARRAVLVMTGVAPVPTPPWFIPDDALLAMLLTPDDPSIQWPKHSRLLWKLVDGRSRIGRAIKFAWEFGWWTAAEFSRRTHDVSQLPARVNVPAAPVPTV